jgi:hypothetical protein
VPLDPEREIVHRFRGAQTYPQLANGRVHLALEVRLDLGGLVCRSDQQPGFGYLESDGLGFGHVSPRFRGSADLLEDVGQADECLTAEIQAIQGDRFVGHPPKDLRRFLRPSQRDQRPGTAQP